MPMFDNAKRSIDHFIRQKINGPGTEHIRLGQLGAERHLRSLLASSRFAFTTNACDIMSEILQQPRLIEFYFNRSHLPFEKVFISIDELNGIQLERAGTDILASPLIFHDFGGRNDPKDLDLSFATFSFIVNKFDDKTWEKNIMIKNCRTILEDNNLKDLKDLTTRELTERKDIESIYNVMNHVGLRRCLYNTFPKNHIMNHYLDLLEADNLSPITSYNADTSRRDLLPVVSGIMEMIPKTLAALLMLDMKSELKSTWTTNVRNTHKGKTGLSHTVVDVDMNAKRYLPKPPEIPRGKGSPVREHPVRGHWCISHKTGNPDCRDICVPMTITDKRMKCLQCGKKAWLKDDYKRGDPDRGVITHEYQVLAS